MAFCSTTFHGFNLNPWSPAIIYKQQPLCDDDEDDGDDENDDDNQRERKRPALRKTGRELKHKLMFVLYSIKYSRTEIGLNEKEIEKANNQKTKAKEQERANRSSCEIHLRISTD